MSLFKITIRAGRLAVFDPNPLSVRVNDTVFWDNEDLTRAHWPTPDPSKPKEWLDFQIAPGGQSAQISINPSAPRVMNYVCSLHPGEKGQIKVIGKKKGAFGGKTKKGAFAGSTKKGVFSKATDKGVFSKATDKSPSAQVGKQGALAKVSKKGALGKVSKKGAFGKVSKKGPFGKTTK